MKKAINCADSLNTPLPLRLLVKQLCLFFGVIACLLVVVYVFVPHAEYLEQNAIQQRVTQQGWQGIALFVALGIVFMALAGARQVVAAVAGYVFGFEWGFFWAFVITASACCLLFAGARGIRLLWVGVPQSYHISNNYLLLLQKVFVHSPFLGTVIFRFLPLGSNYIFTLFAGWSTMRTKPFLAGSFIGYIPQVLIFSLVGSGIGQDWWNLASACVLFVLSIGTGIFLYRRIAV